MATEHASIVGQRRGERRGERDGMIRSAFAAGVPVSGTDGGDRAEPGAARSDQAGRAINH